MLFGQKTDIGYLGLMAVLMSPIIFVISYFTRKFEVIVAAVCLVVLAGIWVVRVSVLLSHL